MVLDGWNELDPASRRRAIAEVLRLRRELPFLELAITTRRQGLDVPVSGPRIEIMPLSETQQLEIARAAYGDRGEELLDHAWRTSGLRELVSIPLYLHALLHETPAGVMPTTKEEVLRLFVGQHERSPENAEALQQGLHGLHGEFLTGLAVEATVSANTAISEARSRSVVAATAVRLKAAGQISEGPQPSEVLELLVNYHTVVRTGSHGGVSFQHQQIQEWYASKEVEALIKEAAAGPEDSRKRLRAEILNIPVWEEPILFACERLSRAGDSGIAAVAACVLDTLEIDPVLAADMIFRSSLPVWKAIKDDVVAFVDKWHEKGVVDRAVRFMITTGRSEFASLIWPLVTHSDDQVYLAALREARRFRPSVLGPDAAARLAAIPEHIREHVVAEIAHNSGMEGMELAAELAKRDPSSKVRFAVIEALYFRGSDRLVREVLKAAPDEIWSELARKGYADEITHGEAAERIRHERERAIEKEPDKLRRIGMLLGRQEKNPETGEAIAELIQSEGFPIKAQNAGWTLNTAFERYPDAVSSALIRRLEAGRELPWGSEEMLAHSPTVDEGPITDLVLGGSRNAAVEDAVTLVGPKTIGNLIDQFLALLARVTTGGNFTHEESEEFYRLIDLIKRTRLISFIEAWLTRGESDNPGTIAAMSDLLARHGPSVDTEAVLSLEEAARTRVEAVCHRWAEVLLSSPASNRHQFAELARAIGRLGSAGLTEPLGRLLAEDLARWRRAREAFRQARARGEAGERSDSGMSYMLQYRKAFAAIGGERASAIMGGYLRDLDFGFEAACVLKSIHDARHPAPAKDTRLAIWPDFSAVAVHRAERANSRNATTPEAETILAVAASLLGPSSKEAEHHLALRLAKIGLSLPHGDKTNLVNALLALPVPIRSKRELMTVLVLDGEIIAADMVMEGVKRWLEAAEKERWRQEQEQWELERWLALLPFSDRPRSLLEALALAGQLARPVRRMDALLTALQNAPGEEVEAILADLARRDPKLIGDHGWLRALLTRETLTAPLLLFDLLCDSALGVPAGMVNAWWIAERLAGFLRSQPEIRNELLRRYEDAKMVACHGLIEQTLAKNSDSRSVLAMVRRYAVTVRRFDSLLHSAIKHIALEQRPVPDMQNAYELHSVDITELREKLFAMVVAEGSEMPLAALCLTAIDRLRDELGRPDLEPRHPNIEADRAWPVISA